MSWEVLGPADPAGGSGVATVATERPGAHHYSVALILFTLHWVCAANTSLRATAKGMCWNGAAGPSFWTIRAWVLRLGLYELQRPRPRASDWVWIIDSTIAVGAHKALVVLGTRLAQMEAHGFNLGHQDVELLGLEIVQQCNGLAVERILLATARAVGVPCQVVSDAGGDLQKGLRLFRGVHPEVVCLSDLSHLMGNLLKKELGGQAWWKAFIPQVNRCRQACRQMAWSHLVPPSPRTKARWLNVKPLVVWALHVLDYARRQAPVGETFGRLFGWVHEYEDSLRAALQMLTCIEVVSARLKRQGLNAEQVRQCEREVRQLKLSGPARAFSQKVIARISTQAAQAKPGQTLLGSSDVIESLFGKYKAVLERGPLHAITQMILMIGALTSARTAAVIRAAMETVRAWEVQAWFAAQGVPSLLSQRRAALGRKGIKTA
jgi:hypothetical protein